MRENGFLLEEIDRLKGELKKAKEYKISLKKSDQSVEKNI